MLIEVKGCDKCMYHQSWSHTVTNKSKIDTCICKAIAEFSSVGYGSSTINTYTFVDAYFASRQPTYTHII